MKRSHAVESKAREALARLQARRPLHPSLQARARSGANLVNIANVALEAGISRTLIGHDGCAYPELRAEIREAAEQTKRSPPHSALIAQLREQNQFLKRQIELKDTFVAELLLEIERLGGSHQGGNSEVLDFRAKRHQRRRGA